MASHRCEAVPAPSQSESGLCQVQAYRCHVHVRMMHGSSNSTWQPTAFTYIVYYVHTYIMYYMLSLGIMPICLSCLVVYSIEVTGEQ